MAVRKFPKMDLHGSESEEVFDLLDRFIRQNKEQERVCVVVGKGRGVIRKKAIEYLKKAHYSWEYEKVAGIVNEGALIVDLF